MLQALLHSYKYFSVWKLQIPVSLLFLFVTQLFRSCGYRSYFKLVFYHFVAYLKLCFLIPLRMLSICKPETTLVKQTINANVTAILKVSTVLL
jgi:hypothetical protein